MRKNMQERGKGEGKYKDRGRVRNKGGSRRKSQRILEKKVERERGRRKLRGTIVKEEEGREEELKEKISVEGKLKIVKGINHEAEYVKRESEGGRRR